MLFVQLPFWTSVVFVYGCDLFFNVIVFLSVIFFLWKGKESSLVLFSWTD